MSSTFYKALGFAVWKGSRLYLRGRYGGVPRGLGIGMLAAAALAGVAVAAQRRGR